MRRFMPSSPKNFLSGVTLTAGLTLITVGCATIFGMAVGAIIAGVDLIVLQWVIFSE